MIILVAKSAVLKWVVLRKQPETADYDSFVFDVFSIAASTMIFSTII